VQGGHLARCCADYNIRFFINMMKMMITVSVIKSSVIIFFYFTPFQRGISFFPIIL